MLRKADVPPGCPTITPARLRATWISTTSATACRDGRAHHADCRLHLVAVLPAFAAVHPPNRTSPRCSPRRSAGEPIATASEVAGSRVSATRRGQPDDGRAAHRAGCRRRHQRDRQEGLRRRTADRTASPDPLPGVLGLHLPRHRRAAHDDHPLCADPSRSSAEATRRSGSRSACRSGTKRMRPDGGPSSASSSTVSWSTTTTTSTSIRTRVRSSRVRKGCIFEQVGLTSSQRSQASLPPEFERPSAVAIDGTRHRESHTGPHKKRVDAEGAHSGQRSETPDGVTAPPPTAAPPNTSSDTKPTATYAPRRLPNPSRQWSPALAIRLGIRDRARACPWNIAADALPHSRDILLTVGLHPCQGQPTAGPSDCHITSMDLHQDPAVVRPAEAGTVRPMGSLYPVSSRDPPHARGTHRWNERRREVATP